MHTDLAAEQQQMKEYSPNVDVRGASEVGALHITAKHYLDA